MERYEFIRYLALLTIVAILLLWVNLYISRTINLIISARTAKMEFNRFVTSTDRMILSIDEKRKLSAFAANIDGKPVGGYKVIWANTDTITATIDSTGTVTGISPGATTVQARLINMNIKSYQPSREPHYSRGIKRLLSEQNEMQQFMVSGGQLVKEIEIIVVPEGMAMVPRGPFILGGKHFNAQPVTTIYLDDYFIDKYEVTNAQFAEFLNADHDQYFDPRMDIQRIDGRYQPRRGKEDFPVVYVTWHGAHDYAAFREKRLPTEAEWEKAARGDKDDRKYPGGDTITYRAANFRNSNDPFEMGPTPVGYFNGINTLADGTATIHSVSQYGVYDMAGNVLEWVADWYDKDYYKIIPKRNPTGPDTSVERSIRGGGWFDIPDRLTVSYRTSGKPDLRNDMVGFRCAKSYTTESRD